MCKPINGCVFALLTLVCLVDIGNVLLKTGALTTVQAKLSALSASSVSGASNTGSFPSQLPASSGGSVELARLDTGISPHLLVRQINQKRGFNPHDVSSAGAAGITQFMSATTAGHGIDPWDPVQSLRGAAQLMTHSPHNRSGDDAKALAAYNGGDSNLHAAITAYRAEWMSYELAKTPASVQKILGS